MSSISIPESFIFPDGYILFKLMSKTHTKRIRGVKYKVLDLKKEHHTFGTDFKNFNYYLLIECYGKTKKEIFFIINKYVTTTYYLDNKEAYYCDLLDRVLFKFPINKKVLTSS